MGTVTVVEEISSWSACLADKIENHTARVGIVGLGYVGLPLAVEFAKAGFSVTGIDVQGAKVARSMRAVRTFRMCLTGNCSLLSKAGG